MNDAQKEIEAVLKKYKVKTGFFINFPQYKILPDEVKLALIILDKHGMEIQLTLKPVEEKNK